MVVYSDSSVDQVATVCYKYYLSVTRDTMLTYISIVTFVYLLSCYKGPVALLWHNEKC